MTCPDISRRYRAVRPPPLPEGLSGGLFFIQTGRRRYSVGSCVRCDPVTSRTRCSCQRQCRSPRPAPGGGIPLCRDAFLSVRVYPSLYRCTARPPANAPYDHPGGSACGNRDRPRCCGTAARFPHAATPQQLRERAGPECSGVRPPQTHRHRVPGARRPIRPRRYRSGPGRPEPYRRGRPSGAPSGGSARASFEGRMADIRLLTIINVVMQW